MENPELYGFDPALVAAIPEVLGLRKVGYINPVVRGRKGVINLYHPSNAHAGYTMFRQYEYVQQINEHTHELRKKTDGKSYILKIDGSSAQLVTDQKEHWLSNFWLKRHLERTPDIVLENIQDLRFSNDLDPFHSVYPALDKIGDLEYENKTLINLEDYALSNLTDYDFVYSVISHSTVDWRTSEDYNLREEGEFLESLRYVVLNPVVGSEHSIDFDGADMVVTYNPENKYNKLQFSVQQRFGSYAQREAFNVVIDLP